MTSLAAQPVQMIPLAALFESPTNPRKSLGDLGELRASIRNSGIHTPLIVRPIADAETVDYEIVAGHRRHAAACAEGVRDVPCIVRDLTDEEAAELAIVDNLQREEMPPLEEADAYAALLGPLASVEAVAARVSKPIEYVTRRLKLRSLILFSRDALRLQLITLDHALLLSKLGEEGQEKALRFALDRNATQKRTTEQLVDDAVTVRDKRRTDNYWRYWEPQTVLELKKFIERDLKLELSRAPWDLADAGLVPAAGPCSTCPKNTAANCALFGDLVIEDATCTDAVCFNLKREAFVQIGVDAVKAAGKDAVRISWKSTSVKPKWLKDGTGPDRSRVLKAGQWVARGKTPCEHLVTGVSVDYDEQRGYMGSNKEKTPGQVLNVCIAAGCAKHPKAWEKTPETAPGYRNQNGPVVRAEREAKEEAFIASETPIREAVYDAMVKSGKVDHASLFFGLLMTAICSADVDTQWLGKRRGIKSKNGWLAPEEFEKAMRAQPVTELDGWAFDVLLSSHMAPNGYEYDRVASSRETLWKFAKSFGVDAEAIAKKMAAKPARRSESTSAVKEVAETTPEQASGARKASRAAAPKKKAAKKAAKKAVKKAVAKKAVKR